MCGFLYTQNKKTRKNTGSVGLCGVNLLRENYCCIVIKLIKEGYYYIIIKSINYIIYNICYKIPSNTPTTARLKGF